MSRNCHGSIEHSFILKDAEYLYFVLDMCQGGELTDIIRFEYVLTTYSVLCTSASLYTDGPSSSK
jgi:hypothetical protein